MRLARALYVCTGAAIGWAGCQSRWTAWGWLAITAAVLYAWAVSVERRG